MNSPIHPFPGEPNSKGVQNIPGRDQCPPEPNMPLTARTLSKVIVQLSLSFHCKKKKKKTNVHIRQTLLIICSQYRKCCIHSYTHSLSSCYVLEKHSFSGLCMFKFNQNVQKSSSGSRWKGMMLS